MSRKDSPLLLSLSRFAQKNFFRDTEYYLKRLVFSVASRRKYEKFVYTGTGQMRILHRRKSILVRHSSRNCGKIFCLKY